jgi:two-component system, chemotaxis family, protein-glutamate methylesterase/glutaminase
MPIRVLVVDDSAFMRRVVGEAIASQADMQLVGTAINGLDALLKVEQLQPDVVTLDVEMPEMDGLTALRHLMARYPRPVVMLSSLTHEGAATTIRALTIGAVDFVGKPSGSISLDFHRVREELLQKIRVAAGAKPRAAMRTPVAAPRAPIRPPTASKTWDKLVVVGASTGGPRALGTVVAGLLNDGKTAYLIVQHMPAGFTRSLAERLDSLSPLSVHEAADGDHLAAGVALVAPGDRHLVLGAGGSVHLNQGPRLHGVRPSVDVTLESVSAHGFAQKTTVAILTGMGSDGADGAAALHKSGTYVLAEDESTCVVYGMPRAVVERHAADKVVPLDAMAEAIVQALGTHALAARS